MTGSKHVEQDHVGPQLARLVDRLDAVDGDLDRYAGMRKEAAAETWQLSGSSFDDEKLAHALVLGIHGDGSNIPTPLRVFNRISVKLPAGSVLT